MLQFDFAAIAAEFQLLRGIGRGFLNDTRRRSVLYASVLGLHLPRSLRNQHLWDKFLFHEAWRTFKISRPLKDRSRDA
jgi:hypothetical protein